MNLDLRLPMGLMFLITGAMMMIFGIFTWGSPIYEKSLGMNINLVWGTIMFLFRNDHVCTGQAGDQTRQTGSARADGRIAEQTSHGSLNVAELTQEKVREVGGPFLFLLALCANPESKAHIFPKPLNVICTPGIVVKAEMYIALRIRLIIRKIDR